MTKPRLTPIPNDLITNRMRFENPWWSTGSTDEEYNLKRRRLYFPLFFSLVRDQDIKRAVVLMGPRRVGKTVLMHHVIGELIQMNFPCNKICFINIENPLYLNISLDELFITSMKTIGNTNPDGYFVFFDEIQYLTEWERHLKILVDSYPKTKFIVSGSAAAALKLKSIESGAGRFTEFMLPPLTFQEFLYLKDLDGMMVDSEITWKGRKTSYSATTNIESLNSHFIDYINFGGYPEVIFSPKMQANVSRYVKSDIIDKVLLRDLPSLYGIQNVQELNKFFTLLVYYTGNEISIDSLSTASGINKQTLTKYLEYLEAAFLIKKIRRIDDCGKKFSRNTAYKIYLTNPSLRSALFSPLKSTDNGFGFMVETAIFSPWLHRDSDMPYHYARWKNCEVDVVYLDKKMNPVWAGEIKWSNAAFKDYSDLKSIVAFCQKNDLTDCIVTTIDISAEKVVDGIKINFIPSSVYAYNTAMYTISHMLEAQI